MFVSDFLGVRNVEKHPNPLAHGPNPSFYGFCLSREVSSNDPDTSDRGIPQSPMATGLNLEKMGCNLKKMIVSAKIRSDLAQIDSFIRHSAPKI